MTFNDALDFFDFKINDNINFNDLKLSYRKKAFLYHPDRAKIVGVDKKILEDKFKKLNDAYQIILSKIQKEKIEKVNDIVNSKSCKGVNINNNFSGDYQYKKDSYKEDGSYYEKKCENICNEDIYKKNYNDFLKNCGNDFFKEFDNKDFKTFILKNNVKLRFAEFLYYRNIIDYDTLIKSIVWQYKNRPKFGEIAIEYNFLNFNDVLFLLKNARFDKKIGELALDNNMIDVHKLFIILGKQREYNLPIGKYFVENNILSKNMLEKLLKEHSYYNYFSSRRITNE